MTVVAGTVLGAYRIVAPIGAGGMGEVFFAHDSRLERNVALKIVEQRTCLETDDDPWVTALLAFSLAKAGRRDEALAERSLFPPFYAWDPVFDELRGDPRFAELVRCVEQAKLDA